MQRMRPHIPPEPIQAHTARRRPRPRHLKHAPRNPQRRIRRHDLHARDHLRRLPSLPCRQIPRRAMPRVDIRDDFPRLVCERRGGEEMRMEGTVARENVMFVHRRGFSISADNVGPGAGILYCVCSGVGK